MILTFPIFPTLLRVFIQIILAIVLQIDDVREPQRVKDHTIITDGKSTSLIGGGKIFITINDGSTRRGEFLTLQENANVWEDTQGISSSAVYGEVLNCKDGELRMHAVKNRKPSKVAAVLLNNVKRRSCDVDDTGWKGICDMCAQLEKVANFLVFLDSCVDAIRGRMRDSMTTPSHTTSSESVCIGTTRDFIDNIGNNSCCASIRKLPVLHAVSGAEVRLLLMIERNLIRGSCHFVDNY